MSSQQELIQLCIECARQTETTYSPLLPDITNNVKVNGEWSIRDELAHSLSWFEQMNKEILFALEFPGGITPWEIATDETEDRYDAWNQARLDEMKHLPIHDLLLRYRTLNEEFLTLIRSLTNEQLANEVMIPKEGVRSVARLIQTCIEHTKFHTERSFQKASEVGAYDK